MTAPRQMTALFAVIQLTGITCSWIWQVLPSNIGMLLWYVALILLLPGNLLAAWITESLFWQGPLSLVDLAIVSNVLTVAFNAMAWLLLVKVGIGIRDSIRGSRASKD